MVEKEFNELQTLGVDLTWVKGSSGSVQIKLSLFRKI